MAKHVLWNVRVILADDVTVHGEWTVKAPDTRGKVFQKKLAAAQEAEGYTYPEPPADSSAWYTGNDGKPVAMLWQSFGSPWRSYDMPNYGKHVALYRVETKKVDAGE